MQTVADWMLNPKYVNGGFGDVKTIATTTFQDAGKPILTGNCFMLQRASFYEAQWPAGTNVSENGDVFAFYLPPISSSVPTPVIGGGEFVTAFAGRPEVQAVQTYLSSAEWATSRIKAAGGWVSANEAAATRAAYTDPIDKLSAEVPDRREGDVPVRRLRPDAGRGRFRSGVAFDDPVVRRGREHRQGRQRHRRGLPELITFHLNHRISGTDRGPAFAPGRTSPPWSRGRGPAVSAGRLPETTSAGGGCPAPRRCSPRRSGRTRPSSSVTASARSPVSWPSC